MFNLKIFETNISKFKVKPGVVSNNENQGLARVIDYVWNYEDIQDIDFDSFTYEDVLSALSAMEEIALIDDGMEETFIADPDNPFIIQASLISAIYNLCRIQDKIYHIDDDEIFI